MAATAGNIAEFTVSEISAALKRTVEDAYGYVRIRGEISGFRGAHSSGHCYFALKDERARIEAVVWRSTHLRLKFKPVEGIEVVASGRLTTFPGQSKYQLVIETLEPAGVGALMALLEARRKALAAEGLFADARKSPLPFMPRVIGVVTSPTGAVIRDILHRLADRFPTRVLVWPVRVQGETSAAEVTAAIQGFNALAPGGRVPRPDLLIVARGGGSLEDLWSFNEESVVRAAAGSTIPLISAVGHETDVTLLDLVADRRAPTPTAAAEMAVPVRFELVANVDGLRGRLAAAALRRVETVRRELRAAVRVLPRADSLFAQARRNFDELTGRLGQSLIANTHVHRTQFERTFGRLSLTGLENAAAQARERLAVLTRRAALALGANTRAQRGRLAQTAVHLSPDDLSATVRRFADRTEVLARRKDTMVARQLEQLRARLTTQANLLEAVSYRSVLERGFALVSDTSGVPVRSAKAATAGTVLDVEFHDGNVTAITSGSATPRRKRRRIDDGSQGNLL